MLTQITDDDWAFGTKIHLKCDYNGLPLDFNLTGNEASDIKQFDILLENGPEVTPRGIVADKGYDAKANRDAARKRGIVAVIPYRKNAKNRTNRCRRTSTSGLPVSSN